MDQPEDINRKLDNILEQLAASREAIDKSVDDKIAGIKDNIARTSEEVQKMKSDKEFVWKREGHRVQHGFNSETVENLKQMKFALTYGKLDYLQDLVSAEVTRVERRNKLIKLADSSDGGWETVRQYECNDLADDMDDDRRISRAEGRAVKKMDKKKAKSSRFTPYRIQRPAATVTQSTTGGGAYSSIGPQDRPFRPRFRGGTCFSCGELSHWRRDCPYLSGVKSGFTQQGRTVVVKPE